jgi:hypothetical protein
MGSEGWLDGESGSWSRLRRVLSRSVTFQSQGRGEEDKKMNEADEDGRGGDLCAVLCAVEVIVVIVAERLLNRHCCMHCSHVRKGKLRQGYAGAAVTRNP